MIEPAEASTKFVTSTSLHSGAIAHSFVPVMQLTCTPPELLSQLLLDPIHWRKPLQDPSSKLLPQSLSPSQRYEHGTHFPLPQDIWFCPERCGHTPETLSSATSVEPSKSPDNSTVTLAHPRFDGTPVKVCVIEQPVELHVFIPLSKLPGDTPPPPRE